MHCRMQAPVPYLNRAIAEEQLGVNAASSGNQEEAERHYQAAIRVSEINMPIIRIMPL